MAKTLNKKAALEAINALVAALGLNEGNDIEEIVESVEPVKPTKKTRTKKAIDDQPVARNKKTSKTPIKISPKKRGQATGESVKIQAARTNTPLGPRPNQFIQSSDFKKHKDDVAIDKKLWKDRRRTDRREPVSYVESTCSQCQTIEEMIPGMCLFVDGDYTHVCDDCSRKNKR